MLVSWPSSAAADITKVHRRVESAKLRHSGVGVVAPINPVHNVNKRLAGQEPIAKARGLENGYSNVSP